MSEEENAPARTGGKNGETNRKETVSSDLKIPQHEDSEHNEALSVRLLQDTTIGLKGNPFKPTDYLYPKACELVEKGRAEYFREKPSKKHLIKAFDLERELNTLPEKYDLAEERIKAIFRQTAKENPAKKSHILDRIKKQTGIAVATLRILRKETEREEENLITELLNRSSASRLDPRFKNEDLLVHIRDELDKDHKLDEKEKLALFIVGVSGFLPTHKNHVSVAIKGDSSSGKDNLMDTVLKHLPRESALKVTRATRSMIEARINTLKVLALSELNKERDGANADLTETYKALAEGGGVIWKRDPITSEELEIKTEQKTIFYATTETYSDEELETRYVVIPVSGSREKNETVIRDALEKATRPQLSENAVESWIAESIRALKPLQVVIPYAELILEPFKDEKGRERRALDLVKERSKRDAKRLLSLTQAVAWLHQEQRTIQEINGFECIIAEPCDFLAAFYLFEGFFELTYSGLDHRMLRLIEAIRSSEGKHADEISKLGFDVDKADWVLRHIIQHELNIQSTNTIKARTDALRDMDLIATYYDAKIPRGYLLKTTEGINQGINRVSEGISLIPLDTLMRASFEAKREPPFPLEHKIVLPVLDEKSVLMSEKSSFLGGVLRPSKLRPSNALGARTKKSVRETVEELDQGEGAALSDLLKTHSQEEITKAVELGSIYEFKAGRFKAL